MKSLKKLLIAICASISCIFVSSCDKEPEYVDYAHNGSVVIFNDYVGKSFWTDGIEQVTVKTCIDGDTVHFYTANNKILKARFYGIDTPESTGKIQPWGKEASNFTKEKVMEANENGTIVISSPSYEYGEPTPDSTGERYVSLVWLNLTKKNAPASELYLLNLEIVQEGLSWVKNPSDFPEYVPSFDNAAKQAERLKLGVYSDKPAPLFNYGDYYDVSLLDIKREVVAHYEDPDHPIAYDGEKVRIQGTVVGSADHVVYIQNHFTQEDDPTLPEEGEYAGINIFTGMGSIPNKFTRPGTYIQVCGVAQDSENFGFQVTGATFANVSYSENDAKVIYKAEDIPDERKLVEFEYSASEFTTMIDNKDYDKINCAVKCTDVLTCKSATKSSDGDFTLRFEESKVECYVTFIYTPDEEHKEIAFTTKEQFVGKKFRMRGVYGVHKTATTTYFQIIPVSNSYLELVAE